MDSLFALTELALSMGHALTMRMALPSNGGDMGMGAHDDGVGDGAGQSCHFLLAYI